MSIEPKEYQNRERHTERFREIEIQKRVFYRISKKAYDNQKKPTL